MSNDPQSRFEARELKPYAETVAAADLTVGSLYFAVSFVDSQALVPLLEPLVFLGRDIRGNETGWLYFQDLESNQRGVQYPQLPPAGPMPRYVRCPEGAMINVHEFEAALNELLACSLRRRGLAPGPNWR
jgi:hypothetical protein